MTPRLLTVTNLSVRHRSDSLDREVVRGVSFEITTGSVLGIIGESGAGKTSLVLALMGLHDKHQVEVGGRIVFQGKDLLDLSEGELCRVRGAGIGMIFQDSSGALDPAMRIEDQVAEAVRLHRDIASAEARQVARRCLEQVGVSKDILEVAPYAHQLSGGLRQRAMIAATLACDPALLVADEPTSSLDVTLQSQIINLLNARRHASGMSIIFVSHDLALLASFADELLVLHKGEAVEHGQTRQILTSPQHPYTADLISVWNNTSSAGGATVAST